MLYTRSECKEKLIKGGTQKYCSIDVPNIVISKNALLLCNFNSKFAYSPIKFENKYKKLMENKAIFE